MRHFRTVTRTVHREGSEAYDTGPVPSRTGRKAVPMLVRFHALVGLFHLAR
jgi:hypothetical protein